MISGGSFVTYYPPGYPIILAGLFGISQVFSISEEVLIYLFQVILTAISVVIIFHLARKVTNTKSALVAALLWMTYPFHLWLTKQPNSEIPFMATLYAGLAFFFSASCLQQKNKMPYLLSGVFIGIAILIRPIAVFFPLALGIGLLYSLKDYKFTTKLVAFVLFLVGVALPIIPWEATVYNQTRKIVLISENSSMALRGGLVFAIADDDYKETVSVPPDVQVLMSEIKDQYDALNSTGKVFSFLGDKFLETPLTLIKLIGIKALRSWYATDRQSYETYIVLLQLPYLGLMIYGSFLAWKRGGSTKKFLIGIWLLTLCNWGMTILVTSTLRYMVPIIGMLFINIAQVPYSIFKIRIVENNQTIPAISK